jgi:hypothetical protein
MDDRYSADDHQAVQLNYQYPDHLNRWLPLVKWLLAITHHVVLFFPGLALPVVHRCGVFAILVTGHYPRGVFRFSEGSSAGTSG